jgi:hypothetical protein
MRRRERSGFGRDAKQNKKKQDNTQIQFKVQATKQMWSA